MNSKFTTLENEYTFYIFKKKRVNEPVVTLYDCGEIKDMETYTSKIGWNVSEQKYPYDDCKDKEIIIGGSDIIGFKSSEYPDNIKHWNARAYLNKSGIIFWPGHIYGIKKSKNGGRPLSRATFRQRRLKRPAAKSRRLTRRLTRRRRV
jgi:hypothetical protein